MSTRRQGDLLVTGAAEIVTMAGGLRLGSTQDEAGVIRAADLGPLAVAVRAGVVVSTGSEADVRAALRASGIDPQAWLTLDAAGG
ncbi:MAG: hypothetical protein H0V04_02355, partial [Chloroflexi bacterium]|nr:hypothetical protein [Chloroflexota bacterium]